MAAHAKQPYITPQEYLERESKADAKSEYHGGVITAMAGASPEHNAICFDLVSTLGPQLRAGACQGFAADLRLRVEECNRYYYPDLAFVCGEPHYEVLIGLRSLLNPTLIIEVLSDTTERADRGEKFRCYRTLASLSSYILVSQDEPRVELFTRQEDGSWRYEEAIGLNDVLTLTSISCELPLSEVYARVSFPPIPPSGEPQI